MSAEQHSPSQQGREFFNSFFSSALGVANLDAASLSGSSAPSQAIPSAGLDCGRDPGPSTKEMEAYVQTKPASAPMVPAYAVSSSRRKGVAVDDGQSNFEEAVERRLAATMSSNSLLSHDDDWEQEGAEEERAGRPMRARNASGRSDLTMSRMPSTTSGSRTPVTDKDGLGWPAKGSLMRMQSTPDQAAQTTVKLSTAVKTILECLGEDPEREGLKRTPERYAKALLWMTRGYEERLSGK